MDTFITRILVPTDFSDGADEALEYARRLSGQLGASLHLLHVVHEPLLAEGVLAETNIPELPSICDDAVNDARGRLAYRSSATASAECAVGDAAETIVKRAAQIHADLIVMGTRGRTGIAHLLLGSVAEHVVRTAQCPVVTVRHSPG